MKVGVVASATLDRWDVKHALAPRWQRPPSELERFGSVAVRRIEPNQGAARYGSVHFDGRITQRPPEITIKGKTYLAHSNDVVFSRIDVRNGAIGVIPSDVDALAFTNEYPIYDVISPNRLLPAFASLIFRSNTFRRQTHALAVGHTGRKRVPAETFENIRIPVPPLPEQLAILASYENSLAAAEGNRAQADQVARDARVAIVDILGLRSADVSPIRGPFVVPFHKLSRWSTFAGVSAVRGFSGDLESLYPISQLGDPTLASITYGISKSPRNRPGRHSRPYLRVANVQDGYLDLSEIKYIDVSPAQTHLFELQAEDVLLCEANGTLANVARPAIWSNQVPGCVHQNHVLRVRANRESLLPVYLVAYMQTPPARGHFTRRAKTTTGLNTINSTDVKDMPIPVPPLPVQQSIADIWTAAGLERARLLKEAVRCEAKALFEAELRISGSLSPAPTS